jgi:hypothetical protein
MLAKSPLKPLSLKKKHLLKELQEIKKDPLRTVLKGEEEEQLKNIKALDTTKAFNKFIN